jgi:hypothetical protein
MSNKNSPDLPTAAKVNVYQEPTTEEVRTQFLEVDDVALDHRDDLVRRSDLEQLIQNKIDRNSGDTVIQNTKQSAFKELLEEVEEA